MTITDYEHQSTLTDVAITLTRDEAEELATYLHALLSRPAVHSVYLSEVRNGQLNKDLRFEINAA